MTHSNHHTSSKERQAVLRAMLEDRRNEIQSKLRSLRETLPDALSDVKDEEEQSVADFVQEVDFALMEMKSATLAKIDEALVRLQHGTYGVCEECAEPLSEARLRAIPFAILCLECQEDVERREREERQRQLATETRTPSDLLARR
jgi:DnaK suppressor protein